MHPVVSVKWFSWSRHFSRVTSLNLTEASADRDGAINTSRRHQGDPLSLGLSATLIQDPGADFSPQWTPSVWHPGTQGLCFDAEWMIGASRPCVCLWLFGQDKCLHNTNFIYDELTALQEVLLHRESCCGQMDTHTHTHTEPTGTLGQAMKVVLLFSYLWLLVSSCQLKVEVSAREDNRWNSFRAIKCTHDANMCLIYCHRTKEESKRTSPRKGDRLKRRN